MRSAGVPESGKGLAHAPLQGPDLCNHAGRTRRGVLERHAIDPGQQADDMLALIGVQRLDDGAVQLALNSRYRDGRIRLLEVPHRLHLEIDKDRVLERTGDLEDIALVIRGAHPGILVALTAERFARPPDAPMILEKLFEQLPRELRRRKAQVAGGQFILHVRHSCIARVCR